MVLLLQATITIAKRATIPSFFIGIFSKMKLATKIQNNYE
ncbi:hypothetical protein HMPREF1321_0164 [Capnocytophaga sp. oral taxon 412 str. F0487]|nr:hypothetical protein HMPREF1321_0164 [Capnocytophaga sp. oral taxon 412 str. F0487]